MQTTFLSDRGILLRDQGRDRAAEHAGKDWMERTLAELSFFCDMLKLQGQSEFVMEDFRALRQHDLPASLNAWGKVPAMAAQRGIIKWSGKYDQAQNPQAHARIIKVWEVV